MERRRAAERGEGAGERYERRGGRSARFWEIALTGETLVTSWGHVGSGGQSKARTLGSAAEARQERDRLVAQKLRKGYRRVDPSAAETQATPGRLPSLRPEDEDVWIARAKVPCWGNESLTIRLPTEEEGAEASERQLAALAALLAHEGDLRPQFEREVFRYYAGVVYGSFSVFDDEGEDIAEEYAPPLEEPSDVWSLLGQPRIYLNPWVPNPEKVTVELSMECRWDPEHGFGALYEDWELTQLGGDSDTVPISEIPYLRDGTLNLSMRKRALDDQALAQALCGRAGLTALDLAGCAHVTDAGLAAVAEQRELVRLNLAGCARITDEGVALLRGLSLLGNLRLDDCVQLTDACLAPLAELERLSCLSFSSAPGIRDAGLAHLGKLEGLSLLSFESCPGITDVVAHLATIRSLNTLLLKECHGLTRGCLKHLAQMKHLTSLSVWRCKGIRHADAKELRAQLPGVNVTR